MPHNIHAGKNEPRISKEGEREHPATATIAAEQAARLTTRAGYLPPGESRYFVILRALCMEQVSCLEG
jgi:hypothetical protein